MTVNTAKTAGGYPRQATELSRIAEQIAADLRAPRYTLGYVPARAQSEAGWRAVQVLVRPSARYGPLAARTRPGYFAPVNQSGKRTNTPIQIAP